MNACIGAENEDYCWICFEIPEEKYKPCQCKTTVHSKCLARWQLQQAGKEEEYICRFCGTLLPDWKYILRPNYDEIAKSEIYIYHNFMDTTKLVPIGQDATIDTFVSIIYELYSVIPGFNILNFISHFDNIKFECEIPDEHHTVIFKGIECFEAAMFCKRVIQYEYHQKCEQDEIRYLIDTLALVENISIQNTSVVENIIKKSKKLFASIKRILKSKRS